LGGIDVRTLDTSTPLLQSSIIHFPHPPIIYLHIQKSVNDVIPFTGEEENHALPPCTWKHRNGSTTVKTGQ
jgi:hypothetical protein